MKTTHTIRSKKHDVAFQFAWDGEYIRVHTGNGTYKQICEGGGFFGATLTASSEEDFKRVCKKWYHQMVREIELY